MDFRLFAGAFLWKSKDYDNGPNVNFRLSGQTGSNIGQPGTQDYLFNEIFIGRQETSGLWSQQMTMTDGGFKVFSKLGQTNAYLATLNIKSSLPWSLPIKVYADFGTYKKLSGDIPYDLVNYNAGFLVAFIPDNFEVYIPLILSKQIQNSLDFDHVNFGERIRFVINLRAYNPVRAVRALNF